MGEANLNKLIKFKLQLSDDLRGVEVNEFGSEIRRLSLTVAIL